MKFHTTTLLHKPLLGILILLIVAGCSDFLEETDPTNRSPETFYTTEKHAKRP